MIGKKAGRRCFYCAASGALNDDLAANVKHVQVSISIVSYVYFFLGVYLVAHLAVHYHVLATG